MTPLFFPLFTAIHHGPPGSYKSFTLVQRIAIPALMAGRLVITNIRDFDSLERVRQSFPDAEFPEGAQVINLPDTKPGRDAMARFFHWAPPGALILIDEGQKVYPKRRDFKLTDLDHYTPDPGQHVETLVGQDGNVIPRPEDVYVAFDMQRHWNWDIYISTPNIEKLHDFIRQVSEWAYRHRSLDGVLPWYKGTWYEHQHDPEKDGKSLSHCVGKPVRYKVDTRVYSCYSSTATGSHLENKTGRSVLSDPKIKSVLVVLALALCSLSWLLASKFFMGGPAPAVPVAAQAPAPAPAGPQVAGGPASPPPPDSSGRGGAGSLAASPFAGLAPSSDAPVFALVRAGGGRYVFQVFERGRSFFVDSLALEARRIYAVRHSDCHFTIHAAGGVLDVACDAVRCSVEYRSPDLYYRSGCMLPEDYARARQARMEGRAGRGEGEGAGKGGGQALGLGSFTASR